MGRPCYNEKLYCNTSGECTQFVHLKSNYRYSLIIYKMYTLLSLEILKWPKLKQKCKIWNDGKK